MSPTRESPPAIRLPEKAGAGGGAESPRPSVQSRMFRTGFAALRLALLSAVLAAAAPRAETGSPYPRSFLWPEPVAFGSLGFRMEAAFGFLQHASLNAHIGEIGTRATLGIGLTWLLAGGTGD